MLIKNIRLINPATGYDDIADILIKDGKIEKIEKGILDKQNESGDMIRDVIDGMGLICAPGLIDVHVHFRDPGFTHKEDIFTGVKAAKAGGFTGVVMMGNTKPAADNVETLTYITKKSKQADINVYTVANVTRGMKGKELTDFNMLKNAGAVGLSDDGLPITDAELLREAFIRAEKLNLPVSLHEENPEFIENNGINSGEISDRLGICGSKREAEISMIERDTKLAKETGVTLNIQHISTKEGVNIVRNARKTHENIHAEATPHHFTLTQAAVLEYGTNAKMNPPLRSEDDRLAIIEGLKDNTIEIIATDHAPHTDEEKAHEITKAPSGIIGLETALPLAITELYDRGYLSINEIIEKMSLNPAKLYGMEKKAGSVEVGRNADIVIFDPKESFVVSKFKSKSKNSPFIGRKLNGKVKYTICNGRIVYSDEKN